MQQVGMYSLTTGECGRRNMDCVLLPEAFEEKEELHLNGRALSRCVSPWVQSPALPKEVCLKFRITHRYDEVNDFSLLIL